MLHKKRQTTLELDVKYSKMTSNWATWNYPQKWTLRITEFFGL